MDKYIKIGKETHAKMVKNIFKMGVCIHVIFTYGYTYNLYVFIIHIHI